MQTSIARGVWAVVLGSWALLAVSAMAQMPTAASRFGLPPGSVERVEKRTVNAKHFQLPDGSFAAIIGAGPLHYHAPDGSLQDLDLTFHASGADQVVDRVDEVRVRILGGGNGIEVTDAAGNGVRWLTAQHPAVTANLAQYTDAQSVHGRTRPRPTASNRRRPSSRRAARRPTPSPTSSSAANPSSLLTTTASGGLSL